MGLLMIGAIIAQAISDKIKEKKIMKKLDPENMAYEFIQKDINKEESNINRAINHFINSLSLSDYHNSLISIRDGEYKISFNLFSMEFYKKYKMVPTPIDFDIELAMQSIQDILYDDENEFVIKGFIYTNANNHSLNGYHIMTVIESEADDGGTFIWYHPIFWTSNLEIVSTLTDIFNEKLEANYNFFNKDFVKYNILNDSDFKTLIKKFNKNNRIFLLECMDDYDCDKTYWNQILYKTY